MGNFKVFLTKLKKSLHEQGIGIKMHFSMEQPVSSECTGKTFQAAQLTHERFLTIDHSCKIFFWYLPSWTSTNLWCVVLYVTYSTTHQRSVEVQFGRYQKNILQEWCMVKNLSCVSCAAWNVLPINLLPVTYHGLACLRTERINMLWK